MAKYVAFLRGINVGGNKRVPMKELKQVLVENGFEQVKTLLATGNIVFEVSPDLLKNFSKVLEKKFGFKIDSIVLPFDNIAKLIESDPFKDVKVTPKTKLYVSFYNTNKESEMKLPYSTDNDAIKIIKKTDNSIFGIVDLEKSGTVEYMKILDKEFGKNLTTRNYNTVQKLANL